VYQFIQQTRITQHARTLPTRSLNGRDITRRHIGDLAANATVEGAIDKGEVGEESRALVVTRCRAIDGTRGTCPIVARLSPRAREKRENATLADRTFARAP